MDTIIQFKKSLPLVSVFVVLIAFMPGVCSADSGISTGTMSAFVPAPGLSSGQQAVFNAVNQSCSTFPANSLTALCAGQNSGIALQQLSPQASMQADSIAISSPYDFVKKINTRLQRLRDCDELDKSAAGSSKRGDDCRKKTAKGGSSGDESYIGPFGISVSGGGGFGDRNDARGQTGYDINTQHATAILDYRVNEQLAGGLSMGYLHSARDLNFNSGFLNSDAYRVAPFLLYSPIADSYISFLAGYSRIEFDSNRAVNAPLANGITISDAQASYGADQFFTSLGGGYLHRMDWFNLRGFVRGDYSHTNIGGYQETGAVMSSSGSAALQLGGQTIDSFTTTLGGEVSRAFSVPSLYTVFVPRLRAEWVHEFENGGRAVNASLAGVSLNQLSTSGPERNWANLGAGVQMLLPQNITAFIDYEALLIANGSNQIVSGGIKIQF